MSPPQPHYCSCLNRPNCPLSSRHWLVRPRPVAADVQAALVAILNSQLGRHSKGGLLQAIHVAACVAHDEKGLRIVPLLDQLAGCVVERCATGGETVALLEDVEQLAPHGDCRRWLVWFAMREVGKQKAPSR